MRARGCIGLLLVVVLLLVGAVLLIIWASEKDQVRPESVFEPGTRMPAVLPNGGLCQFIFGDDWRNQLGDGGTRLISPGISPDGKLRLITTGRFYYVSDDEVFLGNLESGEIRQLTHNESDEYSAVWTPDGEWLVYGYDSLRERGIFRMRRDGRNRERIVEQVSETITVSPDGQYLAYVEPIFNQGDTLWRATMDGSSEPVPLLTDVSGFMSSIAWSPDGTQVAFALQNSYDHDIAGLLSSLPSQSNNVQTVVSVDKNDNVISVRWSPDGEWLLIYVGDYSPGSSRYFSWYKVRPNGDDFSELPECKP